MGDPVKSGVVASYAKPGGNITALSVGYIDGFAGKWLELILELVPRSRTIAVITNTGNPVVKQYTDDIEQAAKMRAVKLKFIDVRESTGLPSAFRLAKRSAQSAVVLCENLFINNSEQVVELAAKNKLPTAYCLSKFVRQGGLISYGTNLMVMYRRAAEHVDKILRGTPVGEIPIEVAMRYDLSVNLRTAKSLGLTLPQSIVVRANDVIE
jgi:putative ABC transport system substrate-binding protein